jgi:DNA repair protein RadC
MEIKVQDQNAIYSNSGKVAHLFQKILSNENEIDQDKEHVWVMGLNTRNCVKYVELVSLGTLEASLVQPRETYRMAILKGVKSIIFAHNHPSGETQPSEEDKAITQKLFHAGNILGINLLDHVIVTKERHFSFADSGLL